MDDNQNKSVDIAGVATVSRREDQQSVANDDSVLTTATSEDQSGSLENSDYQESSRNRVYSKRKRPRAELPWLYTHDWWSKGDPPRL